MDCLCKVGHVISILWALSENALFALYTIKPQVPQFKINLPHFTRRAVRIIMLTGKIFVGRLKRISNLLREWEKGRRGVICFYIEWKGRGREKHQ